MQCLGRSDKMYAVDKARTLKHSSRRACEGKNTYSRLAVIYLGIQFALCSGCRAGNNSNSYKTWRNDKAVLTQTLSAHEAANLSR